MKKGIFQRFLLKVFLLLSLSSIAQTFELTPEGFISGDKDYIVLNIDDQSKENLYKKALLHFSSYFKSPKDVISSVENEVITINGYAPSAIRRNAAHAFNMNYSITFRFKDNKLKIEAPSISLRNLSQTLHIKWTSFSMGDDFGIYGKKNKLKCKSAKDDLERFFDYFINDLHMSLIKNDDW